MERDDPENGTEVSYNLLPSHNEKTLNAIKVPRAVKRITFNPSEASPGETLYVHVPKLNQKEVIVLVVANAFLTIAKHVDFSEPHHDEVTTAEQSSVNAE